MGGTQHYSQLNQVHGLQVICDRISHILAAHQLMGCYHVEETLGDVRISSDCCHGFCISNCFQIVNNDLEAIKETLPKLVASYTSYNAISTPVADLLVWIDRVSTSAISSDAVEKIKALEVGHVHVFYILM